MILTIRLVLCHSSFEKLESGSTLDTFPPGYISNTQGNQANGKEIGPGWGWGAMLLNNLEQAPLFNSVNFSLLTSNPGSMTGAR